MFAPWDIEARYLQLADRAARLADVWAAFAALCRLPATSPAVDAGGVTAWVVGDELQVDVGVVNVSHLVRRIDMDAERCVALRATRTLRLEDDEDEWDYERLLVELAFPLDAAPSPPDTLLRGRGPTPIVRGLATPPDDDTLPVGAWIAAVHATETFRALALHAPLAIAHEHTTRD